MHFQLLESLLLFFTIFSVWTLETFRELLIIIFRDTLSEIVCILGGLPHRLLWLPAVLHRQVEFSLHLLLQHPTLQRPQEEASHQLGGNDHPADEPASSSFPARTAAPPTDVDDVPATTSLYSLFSV